jgi:hypothetical protein
MSSQFCLRVCVCLCVCVCVCVYVCVCVCETVPLSTSNQFVDSYKIQ